MKHKFKLDRLRDPQSNYYVFDCVNCDETYEVGKLLFQWAATRGNTGCTLLFPQTVCDGNFNSKFNQQRLRAIGRLVGLPEGSFVVSRPLIQSSRRLFDDR